MTSVYNDTSNSKIATDLTTFKSVYEDKLIEARTNMLSIGKSCDVFNTAHKQATRYDNESDYDFATRIVEILIKLNQFAGFYACAKQEYSDILYKVKEYYDTQSAAVCENMVYIDKRYNAYKTAHNTATQYYNESDDVFAKRVTTLLIKVNYLARNYTRATQLYCDIRTAYNVADANCVAFKLV